MVMKDLWTKVGSEFHGNYYDFPPVYSFPRPAQRPHPPIILGSKAPNVFKRIVDWGDGWMPNRITPEEVRRGRDTLDELAQRIGRDSASVEVTVFGQPNDSDLVKQLGEAGADRVVITLTTAPEDQALTQLDGIAQKMLV